MSTAMLVIVYVICGFFAGLAALLLAGRTNSGFPNAGIGAELDAIAAVIIGGASFFGGRGTVLGVFAGVLIMGLLAQRPQPDECQRLLAAAPHRPDHHSRRVDRRAPPASFRPQVTETGRRTFSAPAGDQRTGEDQMEGNP